MKTIGDRIKAKRKELNLTQLDLAEKLNVTDRAVSKWEQNEGNPDFSLLANIAEVLDVSLDYLITGKEEEAVSIDDMDEVKRAIYICKKDDIKLFNKYLKAKDTTLFDSNFIYQSKHQIAEAKTDEAIKTTTISNKSYKIFNLLLDEFVTLKTAKEFLRQNHNFGLNFPACFVNENLDEIIRMSAKLGRIDVLDVLKVKYFTIIESKKTSQNTARYDYTVPQTLSKETLDYVLDEKNVPSSIVDYFTNLNLWFQDNDIPRRDMFDYEKKYRFCTMIDIIVEKLYSDKKYDLLEKVMIQLEKNLSDSIDLFNKKIEENKHECYYKIYFEDEKCVFRNTYNSGNPREVFAYVPDIKLAYDKAKTGIDKKWLTRFNNYKKTLQDNLGVKNKTYMSDIEIKQFFSLNDKTLSESAKRDARCINNRIIVVNELTSTMDLKYIKQILDNNYLTYFEFALDSIIKNNVKDLFKFLIDNNLTSLASRLLMSDEVDPEHKGFLQEAWTTFNFGSDDINKLLKKQYDLFGLITDNKTPSSDDIRHWIMHNVKLLEKTQKPWRNSEKIEPFYTDLKDNGYLELIRTEKEKIYNSVVLRLEEIKKAEAERLERAKAVKGLTKEYFADLLKKEVDELFIIKICALLDAIYKFDYHVDGEDFFGRMNAYFKMLEDEAPKSRTCDDGWGHMVLDNEYENSVVIPEKERIQKLKNLFYRLRVQRNNIAHSESNKVEELKKAELKEVLDYVFSINKMGV